MAASLSCTGSSRTRTWFVSSAGLFSILVLAGCQSTLPSERTLQVISGDRTSPASPVKPPPQPDPSAGQGGHHRSARGQKGSPPPPVARLLPPQSASPLSPEEPAPGTASEGLPLDAVIRMTLANNPQLAVIRQQHGIAAAGIVIARTYPYNPIAQAQLLDVN